MNYATEIQNLGLKATLPRIKILALFQSSQEQHLSADEVYKRLSMDGVEVGVATVYRVLMQFEQAGILRRNQFEGSHDGGKAVYELDNGPHHDHLLCLDCGRVEEFFDAQIEQRQEAIAKERGFKLHDHALSLYAHCTKDKCAFRDAPQKDSAGNSNPAG